LLPRWEPKATPVLVMTGLARMIEKRLLASRFSKLLGVVEYREISRLRLPQHDVTDMVLAEDDVVAWITSVMNKPIAVNDVTLDETEV
jgi:hypothetical protein